MNSRKFNREYKIEGKLLNILITANIEYQVIPEHLDADWNIYVRACKNVIGCTVLSVMIYRDCIDQFVEPPQRLYEFIKNKFIKDTIYYG